MDLSAVGALLELPFQCGICGKDFFSDDLENHMKTHTEEEQAENSTGVQEHVTEAKRDIVESETKKIAENGGGEKVMKKREGSKRKETVGEGISDMKKGNVQHCMYVASTESSATSKDGKVKSRSRGKKPPKDKVAESHSNDTDSPINDTTGTLTEVSHETSVGSSSKVKSKAGKGKSSAKKALPDKDQVATENILQSPIDFCNAKVSEDCVPSSEIQIEIETNKKKSLNSTVVSTQSHIQVSDMNTITQDGLKEPTNCIPKFTEVVSKKTKGRGKKATVGVVDLETSSGTFESNTRKLVTQDEGQESLSPGLPNTASAASLDIADIPKTKGKRGRSKSKKTSKDKEECLIKEFDAESACKEAKKHVSPHRKKSPASTVKPDIVLSNQEQGCPSAEADKFHKPIEVIKESGNKAELLNKEEKVTGTSQKCSQVQVIGEAKCVDGNNGPVHEINIVTTASEIVSNATNIPLEQEKKTHASQKRIKIRTQRSPAKTNPSKHEKEYKQTPESENLVTLSEELEDRIQTKGLVNKDRNERSSPQRQKKILENVQESKTKNDNSITSDNQDLLPSIPAGQNEQMFANKISRNFSPGKNNDQTGLNETLDKDQQEKAATAIVHTGKPQEPGKKSSISSSNNEKVKHSSPKRNRKSQSKSRTPMLDIENPAGTVDTNMESSVDTSDKNTIDRSTRKENNLSNSYCNLGESLTAVDKQHPKKCDPDHIIQTNSAKIVEDIHESPKRRGKKSGHSRGTIVNTAPKDNLEDEKDDELKSSELTSYGNDMESKDKASPSISRCGSEKKEASGVNQPSELQDADQKSRAMSSSKAKSRNVSPKRKKSPSKNRTTTMDHFQNNKTAGEANAQTEPSESSLIEKENVKSARNEDQQPSFKCSSEGSAISKDEQYSELQDTDLKGSKQSASEIKDSRTSPRRKGKLFMSQTRATTLNVVQNDETVKSMELEGIYETTPSSIDNDNSNLEEIKRSRSAQPETHQLSKGKTSSHKRRKKSSSRSRAKPEKSKQDQVATIAEAQKDSSELSSHKSESVNYPNQDSLPCSKHQNLNPDANLATETKAADLSNINQNEEIEMTIKSPQQTKNGKKKSLPECISSRKTRSPVRKKNPRLQNATEISDEHVANNLSAENSKKELREVHTDDLDTMEITCVDDSQYDSQQAQNNRNGLKTKRKCKSAPPQRKRRSKSQINKATSNKVVNKPVSYVNKTAEHTSSTVDHDDEESVVEDGVKPRKRQARSLSRTESKIHNIEKEVLLATSKLTVQGPDEIVADKDNMTHATLTKKKNSRNRTNTEVENKKEDAKASSGDEPTPMCISETSIKDNCVDAVAITTESLNLTQSKTSKAKNNLMNPSKGKQIQKSARLTDSELLELYSIQSSVVKLHRVSTDTDDNSKDNEESRENDCVNTDVGHNPVDADQGSPTRRGKKCKPGPKSSKFNHEKDKTDIEEQRTLNTENQDITDVKPKESDDEIPLKDKIQNSKLKATRRRTNRLLKSSNKNVNGGTVEDTSENHIESSNEEHVTSSSGEKVDEDFWNSIADNNSESQSRPSCNDQHSSNTEKTVENPISALSLDIGKAVKDPAEISEDEIEQTLFALGLGISLPVPASDSKEKSARGQSYSKTGSSSRSKSPEPSTSRGRVSGQKKTARKSVRDQNLNFKVQYPPRESKLRLRSLTKVEMALMNNPHSAFGKQSWLKHKFDLDSESDDDWEIDLPIDNRLITANATNSSNMDSVTVPASSVNQTSSSGNSQLTAQSSTDKTRSLSDIELMKKFGISDVSVVVKKKPCDKKEILPQIKVPCSIDIEDVKVTEDNTNKAAIIAPTKKAGPTKRGRPGRKAKVISDDVISQQDAQQLSGEENEESDKQQISTNQKAKGDEDNISDVLDKTKDCLSVVSDSTLINIENEKAIQKEDEEEVTVPSEVKILSEVKSLKEQVEMRRNREKSTKVFATKGHTKEGGSVMKKDKTNVENAQKSKGDTEAVIDVITVKSSIKEITFPPKGKKRGSKPKTATHDKENTNITCNISDGVILQTEHEPTEPYCVVETHGKCIEDCQQEAYREQSEENEVIKVKKNNPGKRRATSTKNTCRQTLKDNDSAGKLTDKPEHETAPIDIQELNYVKNDLINTETDNSSTDNPIHELNNDDVKTLPRRGRKSLFLNKTKTNDSMIGINDTNTKRKDSGIPEREQEPGVKESAHGPSKHTLTESIEEHSVSITEVVKPAVAACNKDHQKITLGRRRGRSRGCNIDKETDITSNASCTKKVQEYCRDTDSLEYTGHQEKTTLVVNENVVEEDCILQKEASKSVTSPEEMSHLVNAINENQGKEPESEKEESSHNRDKSQTPAEDKIGNNMIKSSGRGRRRGRKTIKHKSMSVANSLVEQQNEPINKHDSITDEGKYNTIESSEQLQTTEVVKKNEKTCRWPDRKNTAENDNKEPNKAVENELANRNITAEADKSVDDTGRQEANIYNETNNEGCMNLEVLHSPSHSTAISITTLTQSEAPMETGSTGNTEENISPDKEGQDITENSTDMINSVKHKRKGKRGRRKNAKKRIGKNSLSIDNQASIKTQSCEETVETTPLKENADNLTVATDEASSISVSQTQEEEMQQSENKVSLASNNGNIENEENKKMRKEAISDGSKQAVYEDEPAKVNNTESENVPNSDAVESANDKLSDLRRCDNVANDDENRTNAPYPINGIAPETLPQNRSQNLKRKRKGKSKKGGSKRKKTETLSEPTNTELLEETSPESITPNLKMKTSTNNDDNNDTAKMTGHDADMKTSDTITLTGDMKTSDTITLTGIPKEDETNPSTDENVRMDITLTIREVKTLKKKGTRRGRKKWSKSKAHAGKKQVGKTNADLTSESLDASGSANDQLESEIGNATLFTDNIKITSQTEKENIIVESHESKKEGDKTSEKLLEHEIGVKIAKCDKIAKDNISITAAQLSRDITEDTHETCTVDSPIKSMLHNNENNEEGEEIRVTTEAPLNSSKIQKKINTKKGRKGKRGSKLTKKKNTDSESKQLACTAALDKPLEQNKIVTNDMSLNVSNLGQTQLPCSPSDATSNDGAKCSHKHIEDISLSHESTVEILVEHSPKITGRSEFDCSTVGKQPPSNKILSENDIEGKSNEMVIQSKDAKKISSNKNIENQFVLTARIRREDSPFDYIVKECERTIGASKKDRNESNTQLKIQNTKQSSDLSNSSPQANQTSDSGINTPSSIDSVQKIEEGSKCSSTDSESQIIWPNDIVMPFTPLSDHLKGTRYRKRRKGQNKGMTEKEACHSKSEFNTVDEKNILTQSVENNDCCQSEEITINPSKEIELTKSSELEYEVTDICTKEKCGVSSNETSNFENKEIEQKDKVDATRQEGVFEASGQEKKNKVISSVCQQKLILKKKGKNKWKASTCTIDTNIAHDQRDGADLPKPKITTTHSNQRSQEPVASKELHECYRVGKGKKRKMCDEQEIKKKKDEVVLGLESVSIDVNLDTGPMKKSKMDGEVETNSDSEEAVYTVETDNRRDNVLIMRRMSDKTSDVKHKDVYLEALQTMIHKVKELSHDIEEKVASEQATIHFSSLDTLIDNDQIDIRLQANKRKARSKSSKSEDISAKESENVEKIISQDDVSKIDDLSKYEKTEAETIRKCKERTNQHLKMNESQIRNETDFSNDKSKLRRGRSSRQRNFTDVFKETPDHGENDMPQDTQTPTNTLNESNTTTGVPSNDYDKDNGICLVRADDNKLEASPNLTVIEKGKEITQCFDEINPHEETRLQHIYDKTSQIKQKQRRGRRRHGQVANIDYLENNDSAGNLQGVMNDKDTQDNRDNSNSDKLHDDFKGGTAVLKVLDGRVVMESINLKKKDGSPSVTKKGKRGRGRKNLFKRPFKGRSPTVAKDIETNCVIPCNTEDRTNKLDEIHSEEQESSIASMANPAMTELKDKSDHVSLESEPNNMPDHCRLTRSIHRTNVEEIKLNDKKSSRSMESSSSDVDITRKSPNVQDNLTLENVANMSDYGITEGPCRNEKSLDTVCESANLQHDNETCLKHKQNRRRGRPSKAISRRLRGFGSRQKIAKIPFTDADSVEELNQGDKLDNQTDDCQDDGKLDNIESETPGDLSDKVVTSVNLCKDGTDSIQGMTQSFTGKSTDSNSQCELLDNSDSCLETKPKRSRGQTKHGKLHKFSIAALINEVDSLNKAAEMNERSHFHALRVNDNSQESGGKEKQGCFGEEIHASETSPKMPSSVQLNKEDVVNEAIDSPLLGDNPSIGVCNNGNSSTFLEIFSDSRKQTSANKNKKRGRKRKILKKSMTKCEDAKTAISETDNPGEVDVPAKRKCKPKCFQDKDNSEVAKWSLKKRGRLQVVDTQEQPNVQAAQPIEPCDSYSTRYADMINKSSKLKVQLVALSQEEISKYSNRDKSSTNSKTGALNEQQQVQVETNSAEKESDTSEGNEIDTLTNLLPEQDTEGNHKDVDAPGDISHEGHRCVKEDGITHTDSIVKTDDQNDTVSDLIVESGFHSLGSVETPCSDKQFLIDEISGKTLSTSTSIDDELAAYCAEREESVERNIVNIEENTGSDILPCDKEYGHTGGDNISVAADESKPLSEFSKEGSVEMTSPDVSKIISNVNNISYRLQQVCGKLASDKSANVEKGSLSSSTNDAE